jgi:curved DNA-binding protein
MAGTNYKDYYAVLGVSRDVTPDELKRTYRRLARQYHPDMNPGSAAAEARFKEINEAYEVLSDPDKRSKYDQFGRYWQPTASRPRSEAVNVQDFDFGRYGSFEEFINELLGRVNPGAPSGRTQTRPIPREMSISLTWAEAFGGCQKRVQVGDEALTVRIPAGARPGTKIRVRGQGPFHPQTGQREDLFLVAELPPHRFFQFEGANLTAEVALTPDEAALGAQIEVPTPDGSVTVTVPAGMRSGQVLRLRGKGWPTGQGGRSDLLLKIQIATPSELTPAERELYTKLASLRTFNPRAHLQGLSL